MRYELDDKFKEARDRVLSSFINCLPTYPDYKASGTDDGRFYKHHMWIQAENSEYIGESYEIAIRLNTKRNGINVDNINKFIMKSFKMNPLYEGVFDIDDDLKSNEYTFVSELYQSLSKFFKTKDFSHVNGAYLTEYSYKSSIFKEFQNKPTVKIDNLFVTLFNINTANIKNNSEFGDMILRVFIYEKKDPAKVAEIKLKNSQLKPKDCVGRELLVGDQVAYAQIGGYGSYKGLIIGIINKVNKEQVEVEGRRIQANRCCLISRDGKMIGKVIE